MAVVVKYFQTQLVATDWKRLIWPIHGNNISYIVTANSNRHDSTYGRYNHSQQSLQIQHSVHLFLFVISD